MRDWMTFWSTVRTERQQVRNNSSSADRRTDVIATDELSMIVVVPGVVSISLPTTTMSIHSCQQGSKDELPTSGKMFLLVTYRCYDDDDDRRFSLENMSMNQLHSIGNDDDGRREVIRRRKSGGSRKRN